MRIEIYFQLLMQIIGAFLTLLLLYSSKQAHARLGKCYMSLARVDEAKLAYEQAMQLDGSAAVRAEAAQVPIPSPL